MAVSLSSCSSDIDSESVLSCSSILSSEFSDGESVSEVYGEIEAMPYRFEPEPSSDGEPDVDSSVDVSTGLSDDLSVDRLGNVDW